MAQFIALIQKRADGTFKIMFPDLPGCVAVADAQANIVEKAAEALSHYSGEHELCVDEAMASMTTMAQRFAAEIEDGAFLQAVPFDANSDQFRIAYGIPIHELVVARGKSLCYVTVSDMRPDVAKRFLKDIAPCACPNISGEEAFFAHDWLRWAKANDPAKPQSNASPQT